MNAMSSTPALRRAHWQQTMLRGTYPTLHPPTSDAVLLLFLASMID